MIEIIRDPIELKSLANQWNELADPFRTPLLRYEWFAACTEAFCQPGQLHVMINKSRDGIDAIAPLTIAQNHGLKRLELLGASVLYEPSGFIYKNEESLEAVIDAIVETRKPVVLSRLRSGSSEVAALHKTGKKHFSFVMKNSIGSPFLPIMTQWIDFVAKMPSRRRYDLRRAQKRAEKSGRIQFEIVSPDIEDLNCYLAEIFRIEASGWKGRKGTALLYDARLKKFFDLYAHSTCLLGALRLCLLKTDNKTVAGLIAVQFFNRFWVLKIGFDEAYSKYSPGILLMNEAIHYAFESGLEAFEFLGSEAPWLHMWTEQKHSYITAWIYPSSIIGKFYLGLDTAFAVIKKALKA